MYFDLIYRKFFASHIHFKNGACQISPCMFEPCMFGGACDVRGLTFVCDCPNGYSLGARLTVLSYFVKTSVKSVVSN